MKTSIFIFVVLLIASGCDFTERSSQQPDKPKSTQTENTTAKQPAEVKTTADGKYQIFGGNPQIDTPAITIVQAIATENTNPIRMTGKVKAVCKKKGCWMILADDENSVRTTFKDYGFFVPLDLAAGTEVIVEGNMSVKVLTQEMARHFAEDAGKSQEEIEKIVGDKKEYSLVAESVLIPSPQ